jgi:hypothetical protein
MPGGRRSSPPRARVTQAFVGGQDDGADATHPAVSICRLGPDPGPPPLTQSPATSTIEPSSRAEVRPRTNSGESGNCRDPSAIRKTRSARYMLRARREGVSHRFCRFDSDGARLQVGAFCRPTPTPSSSDFNWTDTPLPPTRRTPSPDRTRSRNHNYRARPH